MKPAQDFQALLPSGGSSWALVFLAYSHIPPVSAPVITGILPSGLYLFDFPSKICKELSPNKVTSCGPK